MPRAALSLLLTVAIVVGCGSTPNVPTMKACAATLTGCQCLSSLSPSGGNPAPPGIPTCDAKAFPGTTCCAYPDWASSGSGNCICATGDVYCGVVPDAFTDGEPGCVCSTGRQSTSQTPGATCYPGGSTSGSTQGICCMFDLGDCACAAGAHTCGTTGTPVATCSAANYPKLAPGCAGGYLQVASCS